MYKRIDLPSPQFLSQAAADGDIEKLVALFAMIETDQSTLNEALMQATARCSTATDHLICVETLLGKGANVNYRREQGVSVFMKACELGQIELVELLAQRGAERAERSREGKTPLHFAVDTDYGDNSDVVQFLIQQGSDVNACDSLKRTPLHFAAMKGYVQATKALLAAGARRKMQDAEGNTPLSLASKHQCLSCVQMLSDPANVSGKLECDAGPTGQFKELEKEDTASYLLPGVELGEELETKSGSSHTSSRGLTEAGIDALPYTPASSLLSSLLPTLHRSQDLSQALSGQVRLLTLETQYLTRTLPYEAAAQEELLSHVRKQLSEAQNRPWKRGNRLHPLLSLTPKSSNSTPKQLISRLQEDISRLQTELEVWQHTMSPILLRTVDYLRLLFLSVFPASQARIYGSFSNWLHLPSSDIDLLIVNSGRTVLDTLEEVERRTRERGEVKETKLIAQTFIPVLQLVVAIEGVDVRVDVTVDEEKHRGVKCTQVVRSLLKSHPLLRSVFLTLKQLFHYCDANQPYKGGLGSYSLFLMTAALLRREVRSCAAEYVLRFLQFYGFECQYCEAITVGNERIGLEYPSLVVFDAACSSHNTARSTNLPFLVVFPTQNFLQAAYYHLLTPPACKCSAGGVVLLRTMQGMKSWLSSRSKC